MNHDPDCLFCKIIAGTIPSKKLYEDDDCLAFNDIHPAAPIHFLMIPKKHISMLAEVTLEDTELQAGARSGKAGGFKVLINNGADGGQEVYHMHMHVLAGPRPWKSVVQAPG